MKQLLPFLFCILAGIAYSQGKVKKDSIIQLDNVTIHKEIKKVKKPAKLHRNGFPAYNGLSDTQKLLTLVDEIPKGQIAYVRFYFNTGMVNMMKKSLNIDYKDVTLGLIAYTVTPDGRPGEVISEDEITFTVPHNHKGDLEVDLRQLNLSYDKILIGFKVITPIAHNENPIYVRFYESDVAKSYYMYNSSPGQWQSLSTDMHLKLTLGIQQ